MVKAKNPNLDPEKFEQFSNQRRGKSPAPGSAPIQARNPNLDQEAFEAWSNDRYARTNVNAWVKKVNQLIEEANNHNSAWNTDIHGDHRLTESSVNLRNIGAYWLEQYQGNTEVAELVKAVQEKLLGIENAIREKRVEYGKYQTRENYHAANPGTQPITAPNAPTTPTSSPTTTQPQNPQVPPETTPATPTETDPNGGYWTQLGIQPMTVPNSPNTPTTPATPAAGTKPSPAANAPAQQNPYFAQYDNPAAAAGAQLGAWISSLFSDSEEDEGTWFQKGAFEEGVTGETTLRAVGGTTADAASDVTTGAVGVFEKVVDYGASVSPYTFASYGQYDDPAAAAGEIIGRGISNLLRGHDFFYDPKAESTDRLVGEAQASNAEFVAKDLYDEKSVAHNILSKLGALLILAGKAASGGTITQEDIDLANQTQGAILDYMDGDMEKDSVLGDKTDALLQSGGQVAATAALSAIGIPYWLVSGAASWGAEAENALRNGATLDQANISGAITATAEVLLEKLSGGIKFPGMGTTLDDGLTRLISECISSKFWRFTANLGVDLLGEGIEEWLSEDISLFGQWLTYLDEPSLWTLLTSEEAIDGRIQAFLGGAALGGTGSVSKVSQAAKTQSTQSSSDPVGDGLRPLPDEHTSQDQADQAPRTGEEGVTSLHEGGGPQSGGGSVLPTAQVAPSPQSVYDQALALGTNAAADPVGAAVDAYLQTGQVSDKLIQDILNNSEALAQLAQKTGITIQGSRADRIAAIRVALNMLANKPSTISTIVPNPNATPPALVRGVAEGRGENPPAFMRGVAEGRGENPPAFMRGVAEGRGESVLPQGNGTSPQPSAVEILPTIPKGPRESAPQASSEPTTPLFSQFRRFTEPFASPQTPVDTTPKTDYDNTTTQGGTQNGREQKSGLSGTAEAALPGGTGAGRLRGMGEGALPVSGQAPGAVDGNGELDSSGLEQGPGSDGFEVQLRVSPVLRLSEPLRSAQAQRGTTTYQVRDTTNQPEVYSAALRAGRTADQQNGWCVTLKTGPELQAEGVRTFMNETGTVGVGVAPDGDIVAVFKNPNGGPARALDTLMPIAIEQGGDRLDCYGKGLVRAYENYGFIPVARVEFNPEYANDGWTPDKNRPYIYFMIHCGDDAATVVRNMRKYPHMTDEQLNALPTYGKEDYEAAMEYRNSLIPQKTTPTDSQSQGGNPPAFTNGTPETRGENPPAFMRGVAEGRGESESPSQVPTATTPGTHVSPTDSVGAAPSGFDPSTHLQYEYGTLPEGESPVRSDDLPVSTNGADRVSLTARTVKGARVTTDELVGLLNKDTAEGGMSYIPITNDATTQKAMDYIMEEGWDEALKNWTADVRSGKAGANLSAIGALLLNNAAQAGDHAAWLDILHDYQTLGTNTAQGLQALRILKKLEPSDKLYMARRTIRRMIRDMNLQTEVTIDPELEQAYLDAETDAQRDAVLKKIQKDIARQLPVTFMEKFTALRYLNMLGNLRTQIRNVAGNLSMMVVRSVQNTIATAMEALVSKASRGKLQRTRSLFVSKAQMQAAWTDFEGSQDAVMDGGKFQDASESDALARGVEKEKRIFKFAPLEGYRKLTNWAMEQGDVFFARQAYARSLAGFLKARGITETDYSKIDSAVLDEARLFAAREAQEATFRDTNALSGWISRLGRTKDTPAMVKILSEGTMPFRKTPANVLVRAEEYSPVGLINSLTISIRAMKSDSQVTGAQVINSWAKTLTGTGIFAMGMLLQTLGLLAPGADDDENKDRFDEMNGWQNYAVTLPDGTNFTIDFLSPSAIPLLMGAELSRLMQQSGISFRDVEASLTSLIDPMIEMSMLQGVNDILENTRYSENNLGQILIDASLSYLTQGLTSTLLGQLERTFEPSRMQTYVDKDSPLPDWLQRTIGKNSAKIPGVDYQQIPYINAWGEEEENPHPALNGLYNLLSPAYIDKGTDDAITRELNRLNGAQDQNVYPSTPEKAVTTDGQVHNLSSEEYVELARLRGQTQKQIVEALITSPDYSALSDEQKAQAIRYAYEYASGYAAGQVIDGHPGLTTKWMQGITGDPASTILRYVATGDATRYAGLSIPDATKTVDLLGGILPESGRSTVRTIQKIEAVAGADSFLTEPEQKLVMADILDDNAYAKYEKVLALGMDTDDYAASYRMFLEAEGDGKKARTIAQYQEEFGISYTTAKALYEIYLPPSQK